MALRTALISAASSVLGPVGGGRGSLEGSHEGLGGPRGEGPERGSSVIPERCVGQGLKVTVSSGKMSPSSTVLGVACAQALTERMCRFEGGFLLRRRAERFHL